ncbi:uncharacterized protein EI97DRAFT_462174 [Westerdykella ornata]|uniref:Uncharacterized protein n=1 Tax=Westerdykella ornata TaxID=318751 RepID=A0A6A6J7L9_WESOR|nr:uncharacterized protein EI97DRAFT_462174 [Westerdykella ornata]KAF2272163.1 hypothetical protein EI97DRAFT_462174 [Westerdykella ornata]
MPRPKRQRPAWLPTWIPFKDGRYLGLARQTILAWTSAFLAVSFFALTVLYAAGRSKISQLEFVRYSRSNTILILRILSEAAALFLASTIHATFDVVQWVLISHPDGMRLPDFLALQSSTGPLGLILLASGHGLPPEQWPLKPRMLSLIRLLAELTVPVVGVLVMSVVNVRTLYVPEPETIRPFAIGMEPFNSTVASQLGVIQDLLFNIDYVTFLTNPLHAVNLAPELEEVSGCIKGMGITRKNSCVRRILVAQELQNVYAGLPLSSTGGRTAILSQHQQVYHLEYRDNINVTSSPPTCRFFLAGPTEYRLCVTDAEDGWLHASAVTCPADLVQRGGCRESTHWQSDPGFSTALKPSFFQATISYDRISGAILSHEIESEPVPANVTASAVWSALPLLLNTTDPNRGNRSSANPILGHATHFFGRLVAAQFYRMSKVMTVQDEARLKGVNALQCLLAITLFFCQNGVLSNAVLAGNTTATLNRSDNYRTGAFERVDPKGATVALAETQYKIHVGRGTLIAYMVVSGVTLLICLSALLVGSLLELIRFDAEPTLFPSLDFFTQVRVEHSNGKVVTAHERTEMAWIYNGKELFKSISGLRVKRRKRKMRGNEELELRSAGEG